MKSLFFRLPSQKFECTWLHYLTLTSVCLIRSTFQWYLMRRKVGLVSLLGSLNPGYSEPAMAIPDNTGRPHSTREQTQHLTLTITTLQRSHCSQPTSYTCGPIISGFCLWINQRHFPSHCPCSSPVLWQSPVSQFHLHLDF